MSTNNNQHRRNKKKNPPPVGLITMGLGVVLIGVAALFLMPKAESAASAGGAPEEYSSIPMEVDFTAPELALENLAGEPE